MRGKLLHYFILSKDIPIIGQQKFSPEARLISCLLKQYGSGVTV